MNISELSNQMITNIKQTSEYQQYKAAKTALDKNSQMKSVIESFQNHERQIIESNLPPKEIQKRLQSLYKQFEQYSKYPEIALYLKTSEQLTKMMDNLLKIVGEALNN